MESEDPSVAMDESIVFMSFSIAIVTGVAPFVLPDEAAEEALPEEHPATMVIAMAHVITFL